jgi:PAS domain S-box-containing protein
MATEESWLIDERFQALSAATFEGIVISEEGRILDANEQFARMLGYLPDEVIGMDLGQVVASEDHGSVLRAIVVGAEAILEADVVKKDGTRIRVESRGKQIVYRGREVRIAAIRDVSDRKRAEESAEKTRAELEEAVGERTVLLQGMIKTLRAEIVERHRAEEQLRSAHAALEQYATQLRNMAAELAHAEQRERRRLAQILHDHLQQLLVAARMKAGRLRSRVPDGPERQTLDEVDAILNDCITESRSLTVELSPPVLYEAGLTAALRWLAEWMGKTHGLGVDVQSDGQAEPNEESVRVVLFQTVRELLFNVTKHAETPQAWITVSKFSKQQLRIEVRDAGVGFDRAAEKAGTKSDGFGLFSIRERLRVLGGELAIDSAPGEGTRAVILAPLVLAKKRRGK